MKLGESSTSSVHVTKIVNDIVNNPELLTAVAGALIPLVFSPANMRDLVDAIEAVIATSVTTTPGRLYAARVSAVTLNGSSVPVRALVTLNGSTTPVVAYIPPHIRAAIAATQDVWIEAVNGNMNDLKVDAIRNIP